MGTAFLFLMILIEAANIIDINYSCSKTQIDQMDNDINKQSNFNLVNTSDKEVVNVNNVSKH